MGHKHRNHPEIGAHFEPTSETDIAHFTEERFWRSQVVFPTLGEHPVSHTVYYDNSDEVYGIEDIASIIDRIVRNMMEALIKETGLLLRLVSVVYAPFRAAGDSALIVTGIYEPLPLVAAKTRRQTAITRAKLSQKETRKLVTTQKEG